MSLPFIQGNSDSRHKLEAVVRGLSDRQLVRAGTGGWTIAAVLAHLAFWDQRALVLLRRWKAKGLDESPIDPDTMNDALLPFFHALDPRKAADLCLSSAAAVDAEIETLGPELYEQIKSGPTHYRFSRALHRDEHLEDIAQILGSPSIPGGEDSTSE